MQKIMIALALCVASVLANAGPTTPADIRWSQNNENDPSNGQLTRYLSVPASGSTCVAVISGTMRLPFCYVLGAGLNISSSTISVTPQVPADWDAASGASAILNKPNFATVAYSADFMDLTNRPATYAPSAHAHVIGDVTGLQLALDGKQATIGFTPYNATNPAGYITSAALTGYATTVSLSSYVTTTALTAAGYVTQAGARSAISLTTTGSGAATYNASTGVLNVPTPVAAAARVFTYPTRTLNAAFQISTTRDAQVIYTVDISVTSVLLGGSSGRVYLEYADDSAFTANVIGVTSSPSATGGVLNVTNLGAGNVSGVIPAGKYVRIRAANIAQTPTFTFQGAQEVLL